MTVLGAHQKETADRRTCVEIYTLFQCCADGESPCASSKTPRLLKERFVFSCDHVKSRSRFFIVFNYVL